MAYAETIAKPKDPTVSLVLKHYNTDPILDTTFPLLLGRRNASAGQGPLALDGQLDEIVIWNRALTDADIISLYNSGSGSPVGCCGDGVVEGGEDCDDGNTVDGDCCSSSCAFEPTSTICRASAGPCDLAEFCDGAGSCPPDAKSTAECRSSTGVCDPTEDCDGFSDDCPTDVLSTSECRASIGLCDPAESCDGVNGDCPADFVIISCINGDSCCPAGCNNNDDDDCPIVCGNSVIESGETCDPPGTTAGVHGNICRSGCTVCGDGVVEAGEQCDGLAGPCPGLCLSNCRCTTGEVPAVSEWGLVVMTLLGLTIGSVLFVRRGILGADGPKK